MVGQRFNLSFLRVTLGRAGGKHSTDLYGPPCREPRPLWACPECGRKRDGRLVHARCEGSPGSWPCRVDAPPSTSHLRQMMERGAFENGGCGDKVYSFEVCEAEKCTEKKEHETVELAAQRAFKLTTLHLNVTCYFLQRDRVYRRFSFGILPIINSIVWCFIMPVGKSACCLRLSREVKLTKWQRYITPGIWMH